MNNKDRRRSSLIMDHRQQNHHHNHNHNHNYNYPSSFSSSLLEEIYRSFDDESHEDRNVKSYRKSSKMMNKSSSCYMERDKKFEREDIHTLSVRVPFSREAENRLHGIDNHFVLDQWIEKNDSSKVNSVGKLKFSTSNSSTSSSDSSSGIGGFSSSESESLHGGPTKSKSKAKSLTLKPIRTGVNPTEFYRKSYSDEVPAKKKSTHGSKEGNLQKRALKLYGDLKKVKQPISPGGKLASFLNSLFNSTASKKPKISSSPAMTSSTSYGEKFSSYSTPSTASSYARSCLSKTPSSAGRFERRSVRFCPVNTVISAADNATECNAVRKDNRPEKNEDLKVKIMEKQRRVEEVAKELLKNYHNGRKYNQNDVINMMNKSISNNDNNNNKIRGFEVEDDDEEEEDDVSCCSSDLFELEIGVDGRYHEELPVYETTHVDTNRAIANGFIL